MRRALTLIVAVLLAVPVAATAQQDEPPEGAMLIILDASGSMSNVDEDGVPFIDKAKAAVLELIDALPDGMQVGLRVYGHREPNTDPVNGCLDTELVAPVAPLDRDAIGSAVEGLQASGFTPIGLSLQEAAADLPDTGPRAIVLISDGEDTCAPPDPCRVAEELYGSLFDVRIESVGFLVDTGSAAEQQLRCIADVTGGGYATVGQADALVARLGEITEAVLDWRPPMTLTGALDQQAAPFFPLEAKADWVTDEPGKIAVGNYGSILMPGETRWWRLDLWQREGVWIWGDLEWPPGLEAGGVFETLILDAEGNRVETPVGHGGIPLRTELPGTESPMTGAAIREPDQGTPAAAGYLVGLHWDAASEVFLGSLTVGVEVTTDPVRYQARTEIEGALDPAAAPVLPLAGSTDDEPDWRDGEYRGPLASGETRWYRLELERGEVINVFALFPGDRLVGEGTEGELTLVLTDTDGNPVGQPFDSQPQMSQAFGDQRHQAMVSGTTSLEEGPVPETVMVGFQWEGPAGQESELRFEAEAMFDPHRAEQADQLDAEDAAQDDEGEEAAEPSTTTEQPSTTTLAAVGEDTDDGGFPVIVFIVIGVAAVGGGVTVLLLVRRARAG